MPSSRTPRALVGVLEAASAGLLAALTLIASVELFAWLLWHRSYAALEEVQAVLMVWFGMLAAAACLALGLHLAVDLLAHRLGPRLEPILGRVAPLVVALFGALLAVYGWRLVSLIDNTLPGTGWSADLTYQPVAVGGALIFLIGLWRLAAPTDRSEGPRRPDAT
jgi:TRAP-type C4-dicarboxylate transport system permease small subunit